MKLLLLLLPLMLQYWEDSEMVKTLRSHVSTITLACFDGRAPGSEGEAAVADYVWGKLADSGLDMLTPAGGGIFGIARQQQSDTLISRNVVGFIKGYDQVMQHHYVVIGARMDNLGVNVLNVDGKKVEQIYTGANGNASGLALMLELAERLSKNRDLIKRSVVFVGFGASTQGFAGAWNFLHDLFSKEAERIDVMINLDVLGMSSNGLLAFTGGNADLNSAVNSLNLSLQPVKASLIPVEPYPSDHQVFYSSEIPSILFTTGRYAEHNTSKDLPSILDFDFMEREEEYLYNFSLFMCNSPANFPAFRNLPPANVKEDGSAIRSWSDCDVPPKFLGNADPSVFLKRWVYQYLRYPAECVEDGIQGRVMVEFTIAKDGAIKNVHVVRSVDALLDDEAVRVVSASPKWYPARMNGQKVECTMTIPVEFRLKKKK